MRNDRTTRHVQGDTMRMRSFREQQLHESAHWVHPVENTQRLAEVHQDKPGREAKKLFTEAILKLWVDSKCRDDPELREDRKTAVSTARKEGKRERRKEGRVLSYGLTMMLDRMRKAQISLLALLAQGLFPSCTLAAGDALPSRREMSVFFSSSASPSSAFCFGC